VTLAVNPATRLKAKLSAPIAHKPVIIANGGVYIPAGMVLTHPVP
jgi:hypothetical protein